nr:MAG TPA: hypothetical protein [Bacteriophage sp.]
MPNGLYSTLSPPVFTFYLLIPNHSLTMLNY